VIEINGVKYEPLDGVSYKHDYAKIVSDIAEKKVDELSVYRALILNDLWFVVNFVMKIPNANHPFVVKACREVESGPLDYTLDIWAREHFKSTIITIGETVQWVLANPNSATGIFSYARPEAKKFLGALKSLFHSEPMLHTCFPDIVWKNCERDAPLWSLDDGLILKRQTNRPEATISAFGLIEGMPVGRHFERRVYDDIVTEDMAESVDMLEKVKTKYDSSQNLGKEGGHHRVIGTYYHYNDPLIYIRDKRYPDGKRAYALRYKPGSHDGTAMGKPVLVSQERWDQLKLTRTFNCQQLLDPSPIAEQRLNPDFMVLVEKANVPPGLCRVMLVDQAGDMTTNKGGAGDSWAVGVIGIDPSTDGIGQSDIYIEDLWITPSSESEAIDQIVRMYIKGGIIQKLGVEKVGQTTTHLHISAALKARGRQVDFEEKDGVGVLLRPAGRTKKKMIESALAWPLNNGKIHYVSGIPNAYLERLRLEMSNFPFWHDDGINMLAYLYDVINDMVFPVWDIGDSDIELPTCSMLIN
jgi:hypothetical protein